MIFLCHHLLNLAGFSSLLPASGTGTSALGWIFFPVSQALAPCYSVWVANIARECFNTNKMSHPLNVRMWFASWNSETGARGLGSMPSSAIDIRGDLGGGSDLTVSCSVAVTLGGIANISPRFISSLQIFDKWFHGFFSVFWTFLCPFIYMRPSGKSVNKGARY